MTREIKFRVWDTRTQVMEDWHTMLDRFSYEGIAKLFDGTTQTRFILMQYTGLKDKYGKDIYEGDIIRYYEEWTDRTETMEVKWANNPPIWHGWYAGNRLVNILNPKLYSDVEIIGNIHENPELLEAKE